MQATTLDLRYKTRSVLQSLDRGESVVITYRGTTKGIIVPPQMQQPASAGHVWDHPFFGSRPENEKSVNELMDDLRGGRFRDL